MTRSIIGVFLLLTSSCVVTSAKAQEKPSTSAGEVAELVKKLANPVASLISVPFQNKTDVGIGEYNGSKDRLNIQPVIPIKLSGSPNLQSREVLPMVSEEDIIGSIDIYVFPT